MRLVELEVNWVVEWVLRSCNMHCDSGRNLGQGRISNRKRELQDCLTYTSFRFPAQSFESGNASSSWGVSARMRTPAQRARNVAVRLSSAAGSETFAARAGRIVGSG